MWGIKTKFMPSHLHAHKNNFISPQGHIQAAPRSWKLRPLYLSHLLSYEFLRLPHSFKRAAESLNLLVICLFHLWFSFLSNNTSLGRRGGILFLFFSPSWCVGSLTREYAQDSRKHNINFWFTADGSTALPRFSIQLFTLDVFWVRVVPLPDHWRFFLNVKTVH